MERTTSARKGDRVRERKYETSAPTTNEFGCAPTGAMRESIGTKISTHLVPYELTVAAAIGLNYGADKYGERNFEKGMLMSSLLGSIERHNKALMDGESWDGDSGLPHYALLASSVAMLVHNLVNGRAVHDIGMAKSTYPAEQGIHAPDIAELSKMGQMIISTRKAGLE